MDDQKTDMRTHNENPRRCTSTLHRFTLIMKLFIPLLTLFSLCASAKSHAQNITIRFESLDLRNALSETEKKSNLRFLYNDAIIPQGRKVSLDVRDMPIGEYLGRLFEGTGISHKMMENNLVVLSSAHAEQMDRIIRGRVVNESGQPLSGASVLYRKANTGVSSSEDGSFTVTVPDDAVLTISAIGYETQEVPVSGRTDFTITLRQSVKVQDQVVIIGYGSSRKKDLTGSSISFRGNEIANVPALTATQAIQGKAAGVQIVNSGAPGSAPVVRIRGTGSILGGVDPLYVVDGIITEDIRNINSSDILSIDILKDASSTAIYGARAANGVVLITTKAGSGGKLKVSYNGQVGVKMLTHKVQMSGPNLFAYYSNDAAGAPEVVAADITGSTYWYDEITRPAMFQNHTLSLNGGKKNYKFYLSGGYLNENGVLLTTTTSASP